jgi:UDP-N-acetylmuramate--alanine ligase
LDFTKIHTVYFIGIGGIGMSALARYFNFIGKKVAGYDKTPTSITEKLAIEGIMVNYEDNVALIPADFKNPDECLIVYTPAIPKDHNGLAYFKKNGFNLKKRSEILGIIANKYKLIAVAGTHGKTSVSTTVAHLFYQTEKRCLAFLGGISKNYQTNLLLSEKMDDYNQYAVVEADEFDRSFLQLQPSIALITSMDADHLDIYGDKCGVIESFNAFAKQIRPGGILIHKKGIDLKEDNMPEKRFTYALQENADFYAINLKANSDGLYSFDLASPFGLISNLKSGVTGRVNAENAVAAAAIALVAGLDEDSIRQNLLNFVGVSRRFDIQVNTDSIVYIDDYAHHPEELRAFIGSVRDLYPNRRICGIFQPHLYSRTRDFADEFAESLDLLDELILLEIYPAREEPIPGINSEMLLNKVKLTSKTLCSFAELENLLQSRQIDVLLTIGAGNIDKKVSVIKKMLKKIE